MFAEFQGEKKDHRLWALLCNEGTDEYDQTVLPGKSAQKAAACRRSIWRQLAVRPWFRALDGSSTLERKYFGNDYHGPQRARQFDSRCFMAGPTCCPVMLP
jgi:hypothetical protein